MPKAEELTIIEIFLFSWIITLSEYESIITSGTFYPEIICYWSCEFQNLIMSVSLVSEQLLSKTFFLNSGSVGPHLPKKSERVSFQIIISLWVFLDRNKPIAPSHFKIVTL